MKDFKNGELFTDSVGTAFASHLLHHYSVSPPSRPNSIGGMAPSVLLRCKDLIEENIEGDIRLGDSIPTAPTKYPTATIQLASSVWSLWSHLVAKFPRPDLPRDVVHHRVHGHTSQA